MRDKIESLVAEELARAKMGRPPEKLAGKKFNRLTILKVLSGAKCLCRCECGKEKIILSASIKSGHTKSCGCLSVETSSTHYKSSTRLYTIWGRMKARCNNKNYNEFYLYGGRGISICDEWVSDFMTFHEWAMANGYTDDLSIDRVNNNGNYEPSNCRWATNFEQANNKRNNRHITYNNAMLTLPQWSVISGINVKTLGSRLHRSGEAGVIAKLKEAGL